MVDKYLKKNINNSRYIVIDMKDLKIDIVKEKAELNNIPPLKKIDTYMVENEKDISLIVNEILENYKK